MTSSTCEIYAYRPVLCSQWPLDALMLAEYQSVCGFYFESGQRHGSCNQCGECCRNVWIHKQDLIDAVTNGESNPGKRNKLLTKLSGCPEKLQGVQCPYLME